MPAATSSPAPSGSSTAPSATPSTPNGSISSQRSPAFDMPKQSLRGIKKPKCIKCGNIARSRCPFQSCKSCCSKAQNPCHIHVLKVNGTLPDKASSASSPTADQSSNDSSTFVSGAAMRLSSLRQLSSAFLNSLRTRKPFSRKDALSINQWRFSKLKEHIGREIEIEDEAFDRYMRNVSLLEETFSPAPESLSSDDEFKKLVNRVKIRLKSNVNRSNALRDRVRGIVEEGLESLKQLEAAGSDEDSSSSSEEFKRQRKVMKSRFERTAAAEDLIDKLVKARTEDDLKSCHETKLRIYNLDARRDVTAREERTSLTALEIDEDQLSQIEREFNSVDELAKL